MSKFKAGQLVVSNFEDGFWPVKEGMIFTVDEIDRDGHIVIRDDPRLRYSSSYFTEGEMEPVPLDNPLNRKLYPNRVGWEGYLLPREIAEKMIEQSSHREEEK